MTDDQMSELGRKGRFARWDQIGVHRIKADLLGSRPGRGPPAVPHVAQTSSHPSEIKVADPCLT
jgi:hypothetical protein